MSQRCRPGATYLITGGLGGLGLQVAQQLVELGARRLILMGRTPMPPRAQWRDAAPGTRRAAQIDAIQQLEAAGAHVQLAAVDVGDRTQLREYLASFEREGWPPIGGVVHLAGAVSDHLLAGLSPAMVDEVFRAKVVGAWLLHEAFATQPLDFFALFSSLASVIGSLGQSHYAAANAFLDALALRRQANGLAAASWNFGPWQEVGLAARHVHAGRLSRFGIDAFSPEEGADLVSRLLFDTRPQLTLAAIDWPQLREAEPDWAADPLLAQIEALSAQTRDPLDAATVTLPDDPQARAAAVRELVRKHVAEAAGVAPESLGFDHPLSSLGIDSLVGIELRNRLERSLGIAVPMTQLLGAANLEALATMLAARGTIPTNVESGPVLTQLHAGSGPALLCLHPGGLDPRCYEPIAQALGRPTYALDLGLYELSSGPSSIAALADSVLAAVSDRPAIVLGWSLAGVVAFELSCRLAATGSAPTLIMLDAPPPTTGSSSAVSDRQLMPAFVAWLSARAGRELPHTPEPELTAVLEASRGAVVPRGTSLDELRSLFETYRRGLTRSVDLIAAYRPPGASKLEIPTIHVRPQQVLQIYAKTFTDPRAGWAHLLGPHARELEVPGDHYSMLSKAHGAALAATLADMLVS